jgi:hypothetical protein
MPLRPIIPLFYSFSCQNQAKYKRKERVMISWKRLCILLGAITCLCDPGNEPSALARVSLADLRIHGEMPGWQEDSAGGYEHYYPDTLYDLINGGAKMFDDMGLLQGFQQKMSGPEGGTIAILVMEFPTEKIATGVYTYQRNDKSAYFAIMGFPDSTAFALENVEGLDGYAHFGKFYVQWMMLGFSGAAQASESAAAFLDFYKSRL